MSQTSLGDLVLPGMVGLAVLTTNPAGQVLLAIGLTAAIFFRG